MHLKSITTESFAGAGLRKAEGELLCHALFITPKALHDLLANESAWQSQGFNHWTQLFKSPADLKSFGNNAPWPSVTGSSRNGSPAPRDGCLTVAPLQVTIF